MLRAGRTWVDPNGNDLAVLTLEGAVSGLTPSRPELMSFSGPTGDGSRFFKSSASAEPLALDGENLLSFPENRGAVCIEGERAVALLGQKSGTETEPQLVSLALLPEGLRPAQ